eukprot:scaffold231091_cov30-Tisochrysis_lutea.AAC.5
MSWNGTKYCRCRNMDSISTKHAASARAAASRALASACFAAYAGGAADTAEPGAFVPSGVPSSTSMSVAATSVVLSSSAPRSSSSSFRRSSGESSVYAGSFLTMQRCRSSKALSGWSAAAAAVSYSTVPSAVIDRTARRGAGSRRNIRLAAVDDIAHAREPTAHQPRDQEGEASAKPRDQEGAASASSARPSAAECAPSRLSSASRTVRVFLFLFTQLQQGFTFR